MCNQSSSSPGSLHAAHGVALPSFLLIFSASRLWHPMCCSFQRRPLPCRRTSHSTQPPEFVHHFQQSTFNTSVQLLASWIQVFYMLKWEACLCIRILFLQTPEPKLKLVCYRPLISSVLFSGTHSWLHSTSGLWGHVDQQACGIKVSC
mgnify:CR=1 FL=1